ncbi:TlpA disulfide reductase family protein [Vibrio sp. 99-8-1]|uniref:TlpA family protein disulfide reductase n=1 Tax=Vibrio sp. 99-8-1 TaxID=2607602 RepID=UPI0014934093|nr:TlpA disulfide reductase family protein [Vibrio sp. 99-8-1]NOI67419.1 TlpA family protein disulfide reductase [Vibrio sp. 99-8-1]
MFQRIFALLILSISLPVSAYQEGDTLSKEVLIRLNIDSSELTIVDFFAEWCVSCKEELPEVNQLAHELEGTGVSIKGVDVDESVEVGLQFQKQLGLTFPVVNDPNQELIAEFKPIGMPALYYIYQGQVLKIRFGAINHIRDVIIGDLTAMGVQL